MSDRERHRGSRWIFWGVTRIHGSPGSTVRQDPRFARIHGSPGPVARAERGHCYGPCTSCARFVGIHGSSESRDPRLGKCLNQVAVGSESRRPGLGGRRASGAPVGGTPARRRNLSWKLPGTVGIPLLKRCISIGKRRTECAWAPRRGSLAVAGSGGRCAFDSGRASVFVVGPP